LLFVEFIVRVANV